MSFRSILSGIRLLGDTELVRDLGERKRHLQKITEIRRGFPDAKVHRDIILVAFDSTRLQLGRKSTLCGGTILAFGDAHNGYGRICVGDESWIGQYNNIRAGGGDITIGQGCLISQFCNLVAANHGVALNAPIRHQAPDEKRGVILEDDVWLGAGVHILPGVRVARGAVVGAGSVVTRDVPEYEIWAGAPARMIRHRE